MLVGGEEWAFVLCYIYVSGSCQGTDRRHTSEEVPCTVDLVAMHRDKSWHFTIVKGIRMWWNGPAQLCYRKCRHHVLAFAVRPKSPAAIFPNAWAIEMEREEFWEGLHSRSWFIVLRRTIVGWLVGCSLVHWFIGRSDYLCSCWVGPLDICLSS
jgi:hypothetical protein